MEKGHQSLNLFVFITHDSLHLLLLLRYVLGPRGDLLHLAFQVKVHRRQVRSQIGGCLVPRLLRGLQLR